MTCERKMYGATRQKGLFINLYMKHYYSNIYQETNGYEKQILSSTQYTFHTRKTRFFYLENNIGHLCRYYNGDYTNFMNILHLLKSS